MNKYHTIKVFMLGIIAGLLIVLVLNIASVNATENSENIIGKYQISAAATNDNFAVYIINTSTGELLTYVGVKDTSGLAPSEGRWTSFPIE